MKRSVLFAATALLAAATGSAGEKEAMDAMTLSSPAFAEGGTIPAKYTCDGADVRPPLRIAGVPRNARSLAVVVEDPDAPGGTFVHWVAWNIDPRTATLPEKAVPAGAVTGRNDFGTTGYRGPCPPSGTHRYFFRLFALDTALSLPAGADRTRLNAAMKGHIVARAECMGRYGRTPRR